LATHANTTVVRPSVADAVFAQPRSPRQGGAPCPLGFRRMFAVSRQHKRLGINDMRIILHIDMDAFFASIEERENAGLKGRPIVVGADPKGGRGRGVVSTASYAARKFGIRSALPISQAWKLCPSPQCAYLPVDGKLYGIVSERVMKIIEQYAEAELPSRRKLSFPALIEQTSIDEAYIEVMNQESGIMNHERVWDEAVLLARTIKKTILKQERLTCSVGIGPNKLIAKIASDFKKPDGLTVVRLEKVREFLDPMAVRKLPGIGPKTEAQLAKRGIITVRDLWLASDPESDLGRLACGVDASSVKEEYAIKSLGHETTFEHDVRDHALLTKTILALVEEVFEEVKAGHFAFRTITVRVRFDNFETHTSTRTLSEFCKDDTILKREVLRLIFPYFHKKRLIRLIGVRVSNFKERR